MDGGQRVLNLIIIIIACADINSGIPPPHENDRIWIKNGIEKCLARFPNRTNPRADMAVAAFPEQMRRLKAIPLIRYSPWIAPLPG